MKYRGPSKSPRLFPLLLAFAFALVASLPGVAAAQSSEKLTEYLPAKSQMVVGLNITKLRGSKYYKEMLAWARSNNTGQSDFLTLLEKDAQLDLSKDLDSVAMSVPDAPKNPEQADRQFTVAAKGDFDKSKLLAALEKRHPKLAKSKNGKRTVYASKTFQLTFPEKGVVWVTVGPDAYRKKALAALDSKKKSVRANKLIKGLMGDVNTGRGFWMVGDTGGLQLQAASTQTKSIGLSLDIASGLELDMLVEMPSEEKAKQAAAKIGALKKPQGASQGMIKMMGAGPLLSNLDAKHKGSKMHARTSMTQAELDYFVPRARQMIQAYMAGGMAPSAPVPNKDTKSKPSGDGVDADWN